MIPPSQCSYCVHFHSPGIDGAPHPTRPYGTGSCDAFPGKVDAIPHDVWFNKADHRESYKGDHGIGWEPRKDYRNGGKMPYPTWALNT